MLHPSSIYITRPFSIVDDKIMYKLGVVMSEGLSSTVASRTGVPPAPTPASQLMLAATWGPAPALGRHATTSMLVRAGLDR